MIKDKEITSEDLLKKILEGSRIDYCAICGKCLSVCPTYRETFEEINSPRGRINLISGWIRGDFIPSKKFGEALLNCLLCGACNTVCPSNIYPSDAIQLIRSHPIFKPFKIKSESVLLKMVGSQNQIKKMIFPLRIYQITGIRKIIRKKLGGIIPQKYKILESFFPDIPNKPFTEMINEVEKPDKPIGLTVFYFPGCAMNFFLPQISLCTVKLLVNLGVEVRIPKDFFCCGAPQIHEGEIETAQKLAKENMKIFSSCKFDYILTDCSACGASLKNYADWFSDNSKFKKSADDFSGKVRDISEFLLNLDVNWREVEIGEKFRNLKLTFDNPCELRHNQKIKDAPIKILKKIKNINFIEMPESDWCCGSAGAFILRKPIDADRIFKRKVDILREMNVDGIVTLNPGCYFQWKSGIERYNLNTKIFYLTEIFSVG